MATRSIRVATSSLAARRLTNVFLKLVMILVSCVLALEYTSGQSGNVPFNEKQDVQHSISAFSQCLKTQKGHCIGQSISSRGVTLGVDGPRITRNSLVQKLTGDHATQCLFWGSHCGSSDKCSVSAALATLDTSSIGKPRLYEKRWQIDVESKPSGTCGTGLPFVFELEDGYWKLVAIPYT
jgi:hypothetical protein